MRYCLLLLFLQCGSIYPSVAVESGHDWAVLIRIGNEQPEPEEECSYDPGFCLEAERRRH